MAGDTEEDDAPGNLAVGGVDGGLNHGSPGGAIISAICFSSLICAEKYRKNKILLLMLKGYEIKINK